MRDLEEAVGQYMLYRTLLADLDPDRVLLLAVPRRVHDGILSERIGQAIVAALRLPYLVFDEGLERVHRWINFSVTERSSDA